MWGTQFELDYLLTLTLLIIIKTSHEPTSTCIVYPDESRTPFILSHEDDRLESLSYLLSGDTIRTGLPANTELTYHYKNIS